MVLFLQLVRSEHECSFDKPIRNGAATLGTHLEVKTGVDFIKRELVDDSAKAAERLQSLGHVPLAGGTHG